MKYFKAMFYDWPGGTILAILVFFGFVAISGILILLLKIGICGVFDPWFLRPKYSVGRVTSKRCMSAQSIRGRPFVYRFFPRYFFIVEIPEEKKCGMVSVNKKLYFQMSIGGWLPVSYGKGRFSGNIYIKPRKF